MNSEVNELQIFSSNQFGQIRTMILEEIPWFSALDVCNALEIGNSRQAVTRLDDDEKMTVTLNDSHSGQRGGAQMLTFVNESGLYALVLSSRKPEAKQFKRWITHEVIPSIRKHGAYMTVPLLEQVTKNPELITLLAQQLLEEKREKEQAQEQLKVAQPKVEYSEKKERKGKRPDSSKEEQAFRKIEGVYQKLVKTNSKLFALQKQKGVVQTALDQTPGGILHRKERKSLQERIDGLERQIKQAKDQLSLIPKQHGYESVRAVKKAYIDAKEALDEVCRKQAEWDGVVYPEAQKPQHQSQKVSVLKQLAAKRLEVSNQEHRSGKTEEVEL